MSILKVEMLLRDLAIWLGKYAGVTLTHAARIEEYAVCVRATLEHHGGYTVTWADRGENQSMNNQSKYNKGDLT